MERPGGVPVPTHRPDYPPCEPARDLYFNAWPLDRLAGMNHDWGSFVPGKLMVKDSDIRRFADSGSPDPACSVLRVRRCRGSSHV